MRTQTAAARTPCTKASHNGAAFSQPPPAQMRPKQSARHCILYAAATTSTHMCSSEGIHKHLAPLLVHTQHIAPAARGLQLQACVYLHALAMTEPVAAYCAVLHLSLLRTMYVSMTVRCSVVVTPVCSCSLWCCMLALVRLRCCLVLPCHRSSCRRLLCCAGKPCNRLHYSACTCLSQPCSAEQVVRLA